jgi:hypothetical protein
VKNTAKDGQDAENRRLKDGGRAEEGWSGNGETIFNKLIFRILTDINALFSRVPGRA